MKFLLITIAIILHIGILHAQQADSLMLADGKIIACELAETSSGFEDAPLDNIDSLSSLSYPFDFVVLKTSNGKIHVYKPSHIKGFYSSKSIGTSHLESLNGRWYVSITVPKTSLAEILSKKEIGKQKFAAVLEKGKYITLFYTKLKNDRDGSNGAWGYGTKMNNDQLIELTTNVDMRILTPQCPDMIYHKKYNKKDQNFYQFLMDVAKDYNMDKCD